MLTTEKLLEHIKNNIEFQKQKEDVLKNNNINNEKEKNNDIVDKNDDAIKKLNNVSDYQILNIFNDNTFDGLLNDYNKYMVRFGSIDYEKSNTDSDGDDEENLSLISSIMTILKPKFITFTYDQQLINIRKLNEKLVHDFNSQNMFANFEYTKYGLSKQNMFNDIKNYANNKIVLKYLSDYFCLNIWILFNNTNEIYLSYANNKCNIYRKNIILFYNSDTLIYEPISKLDLETFIFDHNDDIIIHFFQNIDSIIPVNIDLKKHSLDFSEMNTDNINHYSYINKPKIKKLKTNNVEGVEQNNDIVNDTKNENKNDATTKLKETKTIKEDDDEKSSNKNNKKLFKKKNSETEYDDDELNETITKNTPTDKVEKSSITMKMKLNELQDIAKKLNIAITNEINKKKKNKTKEQLIKDILDNL